MCNSAGCCSARVKSYSQHIFAQLCSYKRLCTTMWHFSQQLCFSQECGTFHSNSVAVALQQSVTYTHKWPAGLVRLSITIEHWALLNEQWALHNCARLCTRVRQLHYSCQPPPYTHKWPAGLLGLRAVLPALSNGGALTGTSPQLEHHHLRLEEATIDHSDGQLRDSASHRSKAE